MHPPFYLWQLYHSAQRWSYLKAQHNKRVPFLEVLLKAEKNGSLDAKVEELKGLLREQFGDGPCGSNQLDWLRCQLNSSRVSSKGSTSAEDRRDHAKEVWKKRKGEGGAR